MKLNLPTKMLIAAMVIGSFTVLGREPSPFKLSASVVSTNNQVFVRLDIFVPPEHLVYADHLYFQTPDGGHIEPATISVATGMTDLVTQQRRPMFNHSFHADLRLDQLVTSNFMVRLQGCSNGACYFPEKHYFQIERGGGCVEVAAPDTSSPTVGASANSADLGRLLAKFQVVSQKTGYVSAGAFVDYLQQAKTGKAPLNDDPLARYKRFGIVATLLLITLGGAGLNLTPCVLPLIPINLAIIGAGRAAHTRRAGFLHGAAYGLGMAIAYGALGMVVVLTGAKFGALNSSAWFNAAIALIFLALSLAMFDVFHIDFTRFDRRLGRQESKAAHHSKSKWLVAFTLGAIAALLAGACVAPVVISVLLMAASLYAKGLVAGLLLPLLLGAGMALPWPFMGASLSFLPKPGKWMVWVKYVFGMLILIFAGYYGYLAIGLARVRNSQTLLASAPGAAHAVGDANRQLANALQAALASNKPVFIDFKASWCKNCEAMDAVVFNQEAVRKQLNDFVVVKYEAERPNEPPAKDMLDRFCILGLPTYLVLTVKQ
jgi:thioredoxin:protein disulfide reductase